MTKYKAFGGVLSSLRALLLKKLKSGLWYTPLKKEESLDQVHKRFAAEQVKVLLKGYCQGSLDRPHLFSSDHVEIPTPSYEPDKFARQDCFLIKLKEVASDVTIANRFITNDAIFLFH